MSLGRGICHCRSKDGTVSVEPMRCVWLPSHKRSLIGNEHITSVIKEGKAKGYLDLSFQAFFAFKCSFCCAWEPAHQNINYWMCAFYRVFYFWQKMYKTELQRSETWWVEFIKKAGCCTQSAHSFRCSLWGNRCFVCSHLLLISS